MLTSKTNPSQIKGQRDFFLNEISPYKLPTQAKTKGRTLRASYFKNRKGDKERTLRVFDHCRGFVTSPYFCPKDEGPIFNGISM